MNTFSSTEGFAMHLVASLTRNLITRRVPKIENPFSIRFLLALSKATVQRLVASR
jgi:hypothetical protein